MPIESGPVRGALAAASTAYLGALVLSPWLPGAAIAFAAVVALGTLIFGWRRAGRPRSATLAAALGLPLHLLIVASGGIGSALLPLLAGWLILVTLAAGYPMASLLGGATMLLVLLGEIWTQRLELFGPLELAIVVLSGLVPARLLEHLRRRADANEGALHRIRDEAVAGRAGDERVEASRRLDSLAQHLDQIRDRLGARRAVLWDIQEATDRARPRVVAGGATPPPIELTGDPLRWAWEEALPLRLETPPHWAAGYARACVVPLEPFGDRPAILTLEYDADRGFPTAQALDEEKARLREFLQMQEEQARTVAVRERFDVVSGLLGWLILQTDPATLSRKVADAAVRLVEGTGGAVAVWEQEAGRVLAAVGEDGGPAVDGVFGPLESEMALSARNGATLVRERHRGDAAALPVATPGERWYAEPRALAVVPLQDAKQSTIGVLAVWSSRTARFDPEAIGVIEMLAPYAALQLRQTREHGTLREHAERDPLTGLYNRRVLENRLDAANAEFQRYRRPLALLVLDVDHFKRINDEFGHEAGDEVLRVLGDLLRAAVREADRAIRFGGEEFVVLLPETSLAAASEIAERLRSMVESTPFEWLGKPIPIRISVGVAACPECVSDPRSLVRSADAALYASKAAGRNRVTIATRRGVDRGPEIA